MFLIQIATLPRVVESQSSSKLLGRIGFRAYFYSELWIHLVPDNESWRTTNPFRLLIQIQRLQFLIELTTIWTLQQYMELSDCDDEVLTAL